MFPSFRDKTCLRTKVFDEKRNTLHIKKEDNIIETKHGTNYAFIGIYIRRDLRPFSRMRFF